MDSPETHAKNGQLWLGISISLISLIAIFLFINPTKVIESLRQSQYGLIVFGLSGIPVFLVLRALRWRFMLNNEITWRLTFHVQNIGYMGNMLLPFRAGDVTRAALIGNIPPITVAQGISTMVVERVLDLLFFATLLPFTLASVETVPGWLQTAARGSGLLSLAAIIVMIIAANKRPLALHITGIILDRIPVLNKQNWVSRVDGLLTGLTSLTHFKEGAILIGYSIVLWLPIFFAYRTMMEGVGIQPSWTLTGFVVAAAAFSVAAPSSPGQIGVFHLGVTAALTAAGQPRELAASFAIIYHALNLILLVVMGLIGGWRIGPELRTIAAKIMKLSKLKNMSTHS